MGKKKEELVAWTEYLLNKETTYKSKHNIIIFKPRSKDFLL